MKRVQDQSKVGIFKSIIIEEEIRNKVEKINNKKKDVEKSAFHFAILRPIIVPRLEIS